jgi:DNA-binding response OmpR family regulator
MEGNKHVVLLVEDDKALNRAVVFKLEQQGHKVISTFRAEDALEVLQGDAKNADIIWLDLLLNFWQRFARTLR